MTPPRWPSVWDSNSASYSGPCAMRPQTVTADLFLTKKKKNAMCFFKVLTSHPNYGMHHASAPRCGLPSTASFILPSFFVLFCCCELPGSGTCENTTQPIPSGPGTLRHQPGSPRCLPSHTNLLIKQGWAQPAPPPHSTWDTLQGLPKLPLPSPTSVPQPGKALGCF